MTKHANPVNPDLKNKKPGATAPVSYQAPTVAKTSVATTYGRTAYAAPVKPKADPAEVARLSRMVAAQITDRQFAPITAEGLTKDVTIVTAANGIFSVRKTDIGLFKEQLEEFKTPILSLPEMEAGVELLVPKIPFKFLIQILSYYRDVNTKDKTEASALFFWNTNDMPLPDVPGILTEGKLVVYCPVQKNSSALSEFGDDKVVDWFREHLSIFCETHSHNTMNAFFSGTDDANENQTQFYGVWGKVTDKNPQFAFRYVVGNSKIEVPGDVLFEWPKVEVKKKVETNYIVDGTEDALFTIEDEFLSKVQEQSFVEDGDTTVQLFPGPFKMIDYPEDWMGQHSTRVYAYAGARTVGWGSAYPEADYAQKWGNSQLSKRHGGDFSGPRTSGGVNAGTENPVQKSSYLDSFAGSDYLSDNFPYECSATPLDTTPLSSEAEKEVQEMFAEIIADKETFENLT